MKNKLNLKNCLIVTKNDFKFSYKSFLIWLAVLTGVMVLYLSMFPMMKNLMKDMLEKLPPEMAGMQGAGDLSSFTSYFGMIYTLVLTVMGAYAMFSTASLIHDEEQRGSIDFLISQNVSRSEILISKLVSSFLRLFIIQIVLITVSMVIGSIINDETFNSRAVANASFMSLFTIITYISFGYLVGTLISKKNKAMPMALGAFFVLYILGYFSTMNLKALEFFKYFSPINMLDPISVINSKLGVGTDAYNFFPMVMCLIISIAAIIGGTVIYHKKDL